MMPPGKKAEIQKNVSFRNILLSTLLLTVVLLGVICLVTETGMLGAATVLGMALIAFVVTLFVRFIASR